MYVGVITKYQSRACLILLDPNVVCLVGFSAPTPRNSQLCESCNVRINRWCWTEFAGLTKLACSR